jgi:hypothetical protein
VERAGERVCSARWLRFGRGPLVKALKALAVHKYDERLRERVEAVVEATGKPRLVAAFAQAFETSRDRLRGAPRARRNNR